MTRERQGHHDAGHGRHSGDVPSSAKGKSSEDRRILEDIRNLGASQEFLRRAEKVLTRGRP